MKNIGSVTDNLIVLQWYAEINRVIENNDPIGLMEAGMEHEEYCVEAIEIATRVSILNREELAAHIKNVFDFWFGEGCITKKQCENMAREIRKACSSNLT